MLLVCACAADQVWIRGNLHSYTSSLGSAPILQLGLMIYLVNIRNMHILCPPRWFGIILMSSGEDTHGMLRDCAMPTVISIRLFFKFHKP